MKMKQISNKDLKRGDGVSVTANNRTREGQVVFETPYFYTIQFKHYKECFQKTDVKNGSVIIEII
ncbi:MAG: hypothetical protein PWQ37_2497 [Candidatus Petromonas sp.]|nr:hypothetical protein [Candidatus Petromonas sp.]